MYYYISEKARLFLKMKPQAYRKKDASGMPDPELPDKEIELLKLWLQANSGRQGANT